MSKISKAFKAAKLFLAEDVDSMVESYICVALRDAVDAKKITARQCKLAKEIIMERIAPYSTVGIWLYYNVPGVREFGQSGQQKAYNNSMQQYRHRWLDSLIKEFE